MTDFWISLTLLWIFDRSECTGLTYFFKLITKKNIDCFCLKRIYIGPLIRKRILFAQYKIYVCMWNIFCWKRISNFSYFVEFCFEWRQEMILFEEIFWAVCTHSVRNIWRLQGKLKLFVCLCELLLIFSACPSMYGFQCLPILSTWSSAILPPSFLILSLGQHPPPTNSSTLPGSTLQFIMSIITVSKLSLPQLSALNSPVLSWPVDTTKSSRLQKGNPPPVGSSSSWPVAFQTSPQTPFPPYLLVSIKTFWNAIPECLHISGS